MKVLIVLVAVAVCYVTAVEYTLETCKCHSQYEPQKINGEVLKEKVHCVGKLLDHIMPCNVPEAPRCICTKDKVTGIMTDHAGTWCVQKDKGVEKKKWACENEDEWKAYQVEYKAYKDTL